MFAARVVAHPAQLQQELLVFDLVVDDVDDLGGLLHQLLARHLTHLQLLDLGLGRLPRLADRAAVVALAREQGGLQLGAHQREHNRTSATTVRDDIAASLAESEF